MWDVFIAYHGSYNNAEGSLNKAREIYDFLRGEHEINCYFFPETGNGYFGQTPDEAAHSHLFLLVANGNIRSKTDSDGEMQNGEPIYAEMNAFYQNRMHCVKNSSALLRVYCYDGYTDSNADKLFPVATRNVEHFDEMRDGESESFTKILKWISNENVSSLSYNEKKSIEQDKNNNVKSDGFETSISSPQNRQNSIIKNLWKYLSSQYLYLFVLVAFLAAIFGGILLIHGKEKTLIILYLLAFACVLSIVASVGITFLQKFKVLGFSKIIGSSVFGEANPKNIMKKSRRKIRFLGIASSKWLNDEKLMEKTIRRLCSDNSGGIEFLLLNPNSDYAKRMDLACSNGKKLTTESINKCLAKLSNIILKICKDNNMYNIENFQIRLYSRFPIYRLIIVDDESIYMSFYEPGSDGRNNSQIKISGKRKNSTYKCLINYYNQLWNDEKTIIYKIK